MRSCKIKVVVDIGALNHNLGVVKRKTEGKSSIVGVIKANAYGHGIVEVARALELNSTTYLGVAFLEEAILLRECGIKKPILVLFYTNDPLPLIKYDLITPVINDIIAAKEISKLASSHNMSIPVHVNIDTGMCRMGIPYQRAISTILEMAELSHIKLEGIMTHFSNADISDAEMTKHQLALFKKLIAELEEKGLRFRYRHISNSAAVLNLKRAHMNMVRPGIMLYGYGPNGCCDELLPVMSLKSSIIYLKRVPKGTPISYGGIFVTKKESLIATIPAGYADGYSRMLSNRAEVIIRGKRAPVVGRICMDLFMVDVTEIDGVREGDEVTLIGKDGGEEITAEDIANMMGTITYEVLTSISHDLRRVYIGRESHMLAKDT